MSRDDVSFDVLRAQLELGVVRPSVIAVTSSTAFDGKEIACVGLARSLARTGYSTLVIDTLPIGRDTECANSMIELTEVLRYQLSRIKNTETPATLKLDDPMLQQSTSQRGVDSALQYLRESFDYVLISTALETSSSFATSLLASADAVLVTVKTGRRRLAEDTRLSLVLKRLDSRFMGVVAIDGALMRNDSTASLRGSVPSQAPNDKVRTDKERQRGDIMRSST